MSDAGWTLVAKEGRGLVAPKDLAPKDLAPKDLAPKDLAPMQLEWFLRECLLLAHPRRADHRAIPFRF
jgi:hypothetical protein